LKVAKIFGTFFSRELNAIVILLSEECPVHVHRQPSSLTLRENVDTLRYNFHQASDDSCSACTDRGVTQRTLCSRCVINKFPDSGGRGRNFHSLFDRDFLGSEICVKIKNYLVT
jgi:hypothetical protein